MNYFSSNLKHLIKTSGLTSEKFAEEIEITPGALSSYVTGRVVPKIDMAAQMARYFNVSLEDLVNTDLSRGGIYKKTESTDASNKVIIDLLMKEVIRLRTEKIDGGSDGSAIDKAMKAAIDQLREEEQRGKE